MPNFIPYDHNQSEVIVVNFINQLQPDTFEHAIHHLIESRLDLSVFYPKYKNDTTGRYAYNPDAAKEWSGTFKELKDKRDKLCKQIKGCVSDHKTADKHTSGGKERVSRTEQKVKTLNNAADRGDGFLAGNRPKQGKGRVKIILPTMNRPK